MEHNHYINKFDSNLIYIYKQNKMNLLVKSSVRRKIIALFATNSSYEFYPGQVAKEIQESPHAVGLEIKALVKGGLLKRVERGERVYYRWNPEYPFASELKSMVDKLRDMGDKEVGKLPDLHRRERIEKNLQQVLEGLKKYYDPEKVILFGSAASGRVGPHSDIDLVVIKKTPLPYFDRVEQLVDLLEYDMDIDFLVYTPEEFAKAVEERRFFQDEVVKRGKVLYEKAA